MTYTYLTQKPWMARFRSHEISLAFDKAIRDMGGDIWYNTEVTKIDVKNGAVRGVELADGTYNTLRAGNIQPDAHGGIRQDDRQERGAGA